MDADVWSDEGREVGLGTKRVAMMGCSGNGRSTLARQLDEGTGLPEIQLDREVFLFLFKVRRYRRSGILEILRRFDDLTVLTSRTLVILISK